MPRCVGTAVANNIGSDRRVRQAGRRTPLSVPRASAAGSDAPRSGPDRDPCTSDGLGAILGAGTTVAPVPLRLPPTTRPIMTPAGSSPTGDGARTIAAAMYRRHRARLHQDALRYIGSPDVAEDMVQEVFRRLLEHPERLRERRLDLGYLRTAVRNEARHWIGRQRIRRDWLETARWIPRPLASSPADEFRARTLAAELSQAIDALPPRCGQTFRLVRIEGRTPRGRPRHGRFDQDGRGADPAWEPAPTREAGGLRARRVTGMAAGGQAVGGGCRGFGWLTGSM